ncbi:Sec-independent protein translocase protein TatB [Sphingomonas sp. S1-29]|uniref:Sec-independent protein translocase protein TatB n=1 Tax=Sphingomonas sp. S1-29 TaxID=2991074 RepID=UPI0022401656|nr:Sec-independent protein translocase protein TatB [Sphingomonas sp. S1-29]UZK70631.1 Sec-independent protein translocase protein TatB [Sphingomonas sp. S1-29]
MLDFNLSEMIVVAVVALLVIGPKDLPKAMRFVGQWVGKARGVARQFRSGFDAMVREAELAEMEKKWADENARIMREHPPEPAQSPEPAQAMLPAPEGDVAHAYDGEQPPVSVAKPDIRPEIGSVDTPHLAPADSRDLPATDGKAPS